MKFRIKELRTQRRLSQLELANLSNCSQMTISLLERNSRGVSLKTLVSIAEALDCCVYEIFEYQCTRYGSCVKEDKNALNCKNVQKC